MKNYIILSLYFIANSFFAGRQYSSFEQAATTKEKLLSILTIIICMLFGSVLMVFNQLCGLIILVRTLQLKLWFYYFFTNDFYNMDKNKLAELNRTANYFKSVNRNRFSTFINNLAVDLINKRNNYTYTAETI